MIRDLHEEGRNVLGVVLLVDKKQCPCTESPRKCVWTQGRMGATTFSPRWYPVWSYIRTEREREPRKTWTIQRYGPARMTWRYEQPITRVTFSSRSQCPDKSSNTTRTLWTAPLNYLHKPLAYRGQRVHGLFLETRLSFCISMKFHPLEGARLLQYCPSSLCIMVLCIII